MKKLLAYAGLLVLVIVLILLYRSKGTLPGGQVPANEPAPSEAKPVPVQTDLPQPLDESTQREAQAAIDRAVKWLVAYQAEDGSWSNPEFPALTALPLWGIIRSGTEQPEAVSKAVDFILSCVKEDGGIWQEPSQKRKGGGLANYNTALCMVALHETDREDLRPIVQKARQFVAEGQHFGDDMYHGGMGYDKDTGRPYADLSNSYIAYEAMALTRTAGDLEVAHGDQDGMDWEAAVEFIERVQNRPESNDQDWASEDPEEQGGFAYSPNESKAGSYEDESGTTRLRSYGSMTYAGLLSFIYANVEKSDPRVLDAYDWATKNFTVDENPGMGAQGLYYYFQTMAKALSVLGTDIIVKEDGTRVNWRETLIRKLLSQQRIDPKGGLGYWKNEEGRWWESDPILATSYALLALEMALAEGP